MYRAVLLTGLVFKCIEINAQQVPVPRPITWVLQFPLESDQWPNSPLLKNKPMDPMSVAVVPPLPDTLPAALMPAPAPAIEKEHPEEHAYLYPILFPSGVTKYDSTKTKDGITLIDDVTECCLIDMYGHEIAKHPFGLPNFMADGNVVAAMGNVLVKFNADLDIIWKKTVGPITHEITLDENGCIYLWTRDTHQWMGLQVNMDVLKVFSPDGDLIYQWCPFNHLDEFVSIISKSAWCKVLPRTFEQCKNAEEYLSQDLENFFSMDSDFGEPCEYEFTHFNSIQVLPENKISSTLPAFKKGNLLLCFNPFACYGILDTSTDRIEWVGYLPERTTLHMPHLTSSGTILVFQNYTERTEWTATMVDRIVRNDSVCLANLLSKSNAPRPMNKPEPRLWTSITEYDPITNAKVWEYTAEPKESLQARIMGSCQRLPNGNTFICTTSDNLGGRIFCVTPSKELVWEYISPEKGLKHQEPLAHYRASRISFRMAQKLAPLYSHK